MRIDGESKKIHPESNSIHHTQDLVRWFRLFVVLKPQDLVSQVFVVMLVDEMRSR